MRLLEFQGKDLLAEYGIPTPGSVLVEGLDDLDRVLFPAIFKAQIPVGGRGKAGAVQVARTKQEAVALCKKLLGAQVKGYPVAALLAEQVLQIGQEMYLACLVDKRNNLPMLMVSPQGGVDIEAVAQNQPFHIYQKHLDPITGLTDFAIRAAFKKLGLTDYGAFAGLVKQVVAMFFSQDASLVEINPLASTSDGLMALDAKVILDDKARFRHPDRHAVLRTELARLDLRAKSETERLSQATGLNYVLLDGDIGLIADGAGTGMLTLDMISDLGGKPANFCEMGGLSDAAVMRNAVEVVLSNKNVKALIISLIGGMTRMDLMAAGILDFVKMHGQPVPMAVRMCGTKAAVGIPMLQEAGVKTFEDLQAAVETGLQLARAE